MDIIICPNEQVQIFKSEIKLIILQNMDNMFLINAIKKTIRIQALIGFIPEHEYYIFAMTSGYLEQDRYLCTHIFSKNIARLIIINSIIGWTTSSESLYAFALQ